MPYINIKITREGTTAEQKAELIKGAKIGRASCRERV